MDRSISLHEGYVRAEAPSRVVCLDGFRYIRCAYPGAPLLTGDREVAVGTHEAMGAALRLMRGY